MKKPKKGVIVLGMDVSLNHGAIVRLVNGKLDGNWYYTNRAGDAAKSKEWGYRIEFPTPTKQPDRQIRNAIRFDSVCLWIESVLESNKPHLAGLEDYAVRAEQGAHFLGEIGGFTRLMLYRNRIRYRLHDPITAKMFVTHDGTAQKDLVEKCVFDRWGIDFSRFNSSEKNRQTSEDLADAYVMAKIVWTEFLLRQGKIRLDELHEKEIRVFNRTTKTYPINLLGREWIRGPVR